MSFGGKKKVNVPTFNKPPVQKFSMPGFGGTTYNNDTYGFQYDPAQQQYLGEVRALRSSILKGLGITTAEREASLNEWQRTFTDEALRTSMPQLEQTLFDRGLGGSRMYQGAVTDLLSKVATQGVLNREQLSANDERLKLDQLAGVAGLDQESFNNAMAMMGGSANLSLSEESLASQRWAQTLPYLTTVEEEGDWLGGAIQGAVTGGMMGGPWGAVAGGVAGGVGNAGSRTTPWTLYDGGGGWMGGGGLDWMAFLNGMQPVKSQSGGFHGAGYANHPELYKALYGGG